MNKSFLDFIIFILVSIFWIWVSCSTFLFSKPLYLTHTENNPNFYIDSTGKGTKYLKLDKAKWEIITIDKDIDVSNSMEILFERIK